MATASWSRLTVDLEVDGVELSIDTLHAPGPEPVLFLHGFGSTKEEYADFTRFPGLAGRGFLAYDAPGSGGSTCSRPDIISTHSWSKSPALFSTNWPSIASTSWGTRWAV